MLVRMIQIYHTIRKFAEEVNEKNISTFAAKAAYFIILSFIPFLILLMTLLQFTRFQQEDVMQLFHQTVPETIEPFINSIVSEIYEKSSTTVISISVVATMWTAGKGVTAVIQGLNSAYGLKETRNYFLQRVVGTLYTIMMILAVVLLLVLVVFGNKLQSFFAPHFPMINVLVISLLKFRFVIVLIVLTLLFTFMYVTMPNHKKLHGKKIKERFRAHEPGAVFTALAWGLFSFFFSIYVDQFSNMTYTYGSLTTIVVVMIWLYMCMYIMLIGAMMNGWYCNIKENMK